MFKVLAILFPFLAAAVNTQTNDLPPRIQWSANSGYCGETGMVTAGLYYGQYMSQYDVRALVTDSHSQFDQLLLGINDQKAAHKMHLDAEVWDSEDQTSTDDFLAWVKQNVAQGYPVIIGVYLNQWLFEGDPNPDDGDTDYDHIVPVVGFSSIHALNDPQYYADDLLVFTDNGLWPHLDNHTFSTPFGTFPMTREQANQMTAPIYSLSQCNPDQSRFNYAIVIKGVKDLDGDTLPICIETSANGETPGISDQSQQRPPATPLTLTVTVSQLEPGIMYNLYKYTSLDAVPTSNFNGNASQASAHWAIQISSGSTFTIQETIQSSDMAFYRAVKADAP